MFGSIYHSIHPLKNMFLITMNDLRQQNREGSHKANVTNHLITSHLLLSLMREPTAFLNGEHTWTCSMLHHTITDSTCNVRWMTFSQAWWTAVAVINTGPGCNIHPWLKRWTLCWAPNLQWRMCEYLSNLSHIFGKKVCIPSHSGLLLAPVGIDDVRHVHCACAANNTGAIPRNRWTNVCGCVRSQSCY